MDAIDDVAAQHHWNVFDNWFLDYSPNPNDVDLINQTEQRLADLHTKATTADHELATAMRAAVGDAQLDDQGNEVQGAPPTSPGEQERPGVTDINDPNTAWQKDVDPEQWKRSWQDPQLADNPPGYTGGPGPNATPPGSGTWPTTPRTAAASCPTPTPSATPG